MVNLAQLSKHTKVGYFCDKLAIHRLKKTLYLSAFFDASFSFSQEICIFVELNYIVLLHLSHYSQCLFKRKYTP